VISTYVLVAVLKKHLQTELSLYTMLQILSVSSFQKIELSQVLSAAMSQKPEEPTCNQLQFFDLQPDTSGRYWKSAYPPLGALERCKAAT
jgi:hypothetical protein